jgi:hypothetical protein
MVMSRTMLDIGFVPERPGKTWSLPAASNLACLRSSMQRDAVLPARLHPVSRYRPGRLLKVYLIPSGLYDLAGPRRC